MGFVEIAKKFMELLRLRTKPLGIKFLEKPEFPGDVFRPSKYGLKIAVCQGITFARKGNRIVGLTLEDVNCPPAQILYRWADYDFSEIILKGKFANNIENAKEQLKRAPKLPFGRYKAVLIAQLDMMPLEPDVVAVFGSPAQIARLIQAVCYWESSLDTSLQSKFASCVEAIIPALNGKTAIAIPGAGDRVFAGLDDDEMVFSFHYSKISQIIEGLEKAGSGAGIAYPPTTYMFFEPRFPKFYREAQKEFRFVD